jgi:uncharacterized protein (TIGR02145 family)
MNKNITVLLALAITFILSCSSGDSGTFKDSRDKREYKYVKIGDQTWMAENMHFAVEGSVCNHACEKAGRIYSWEEALKACPKGWHLPNNTEWKMLIDAIGGVSVAGSKLKAKESWGSKDDNANTDELGFSAFSTHYIKSPLGNCWWWSNAEQSPGFAYAYYIVASIDSIGLESNDKTDGFSVRCVKDDKTEYAKEVIKPAAIEVVYDSLTDTRDKKKYKTVTIGEHTWMAENLNYNSKGSECYGNDPENCKKYGRLYPDYEVCPSGWHKSTINEWEALSKDASRLRAKEGWSGNGNGTDDFGITALPGGYGNKGGTFSDVGDYGTWWASNSGSLDYFGYCIRSSKNSAFSCAAKDDSENMLSIRCVKNYTCGKYTYSPIPSNACCGDKTTYDYNERFCYKEKVYALCGGSRGSEYNPETQVCHKNSEVMEKKCDGKSYKYDTQICRNGTILEKCGGEGYDPAKEYCSEGTITPAYGYMTDAGGKAYRTTKIGEQVWMAENMNYGYKGSKCHGDKYANCEKYGRLYNWEVAKKVCPKGWHLPKKDEFETLVNTAAGIEGSTYYASRPLKSMDVSWVQYCMDADETCFFGYGSDKSGFSALPGSMDGGTLSGETGYWWSASDSGSEAYGMAITNFVEQEPYYESYSKNFLFSVRCIQD